MPGTPSSGSIRGCRLKLGFDARVSLRFLLPICGLHGSPSSRIQGAFSLQRFERKQVAHLPILSFRLQ
jgi:hypothetical protein